MLDFYRDPATRALVKRHFDVVVNRVNAYSGVRYGDDPTIMAWDVINEPRCPGEAGDPCYGMRKFCVHQLPDAPPFLRWPSYHIQASQ